MSDKLFNNFNRDKRSIHSRMGLGARQVFGMVGMLAMMALLVGCDNQAHFTKAEEDQMKNKPAGIPPEAQKMMADKQADSARRYQEDMKRLGRQSNAPVPPPGAGPGVGGPR